MSLLTYPELLAIVQTGILTCPADSPFNVVPFSNINGASIDVRLGQVFYTEDPTQATEVNLSAKAQLPMHREELGWDETFILRPGQFILAQTIEEFNLPNNIAAEFRLKSSVARAGLDQALAVWCDPGWHGSVLTIELRNNTQFNNLLLQPGMKIGQVVFYKGTAVPTAASYATRGQYNNDKETTQNKGVK